MSNEIAPKVEVIEDGQSVSSERLDPAVAQFIMTAAQTAQLVKMRKLEESKVPTGTKSLKYTVTTNIIHVKLSPFWISLSLINDGDSDVYISTTDEHDLSDQVAVKKNETININMDYPVIKEIWLKSDDSAAVRIHGKEGKNV